MGNSELTALDELKKTVIDQKKAFLPPQADDPALEPLHEAVQYYDQIVSQVVIAALQGVQPADIGSSAHEESRAAIERLLDAAGDSSRKIALYRAYIARLDRMLALARQVLGGSPRS